MRETCPASRGGFAEHAGSNNVCSRARGARWAIVAEAKERFSDGSLRSAGGIPEMAE